jgi:hypothetical protein
MIGRARITLLFLVIAATCRPAGTAHGENIVIRKLRGAGRAIGSVIGAPVGGFAEAASTPTLRSAESSGRRLLYDFEGVAARRMDQAGQLVGNVVDKTFAGSGKLVDKVDASLEARIVQVTTSVNGTVDHVAEKTQVLIGAADRMIAANIARARKATIQILDRVDRVAADRLAQIDEIIRLRLGDVGQIVQTTLAQVDEIARQRIEQLDEVAGRRIGNLDVLATKQSLGLETMLVRLATLLGAFFFFAFLMWAAWNNFVKHSNLIARIRENGTTAAEQRTIGRKLGLWALQTGFALVCLGLVVGVAYVMPRDAQQRSAAQVAEHAAALTNAVRAYDFTAVRYHQSQLEILRPGDPSFRGIARKAELLRDVLDRPARLSSAEGLRGIETELEAARALIPDDPDLLVIEAYVIWQIGTTRGDELAAADLCARALAIEPASFTARFQPSTFMLRALAENYVRRFRHDPYQPEADEVEALARVTAARIPDESHLRQLAHVLAYDRLVADLDAGLGPAYVAMLDAHVVYARAAAAKPYDRAAVTQALAARTDAAEAVVALWERFDEGLATSPQLAGDPTTLNAFTLDDAVLSQALYFWDEAHPREGEPAAVPEKTPPVVALPPLFFDDAAPPRPTAAPAARTAARPTRENPKVRRRAAAAPLRTVWARRWSETLGKHTQDLLAKEEADRFRGLERRARDFADAYVKLRTAPAAAVSVPGTEEAKAAAAAAATAAETAAAMGLYKVEGGVRRFLATDLLSEADKLGAPIDRLRVRITELQKTRRLRFL